MKAAISQETVTDSDSSSNDSTSDSESEAQVPSKTPVQKSTSNPKSKQMTERPQSSSESSSESSSPSSGSESESEIQEIQKSAIPKNSSEKRVTIADGHATEAMIPVKPFRPPEGFQLVQKSSLPPSKLAILLRPYCYRRQRLDVAQTFHVERVVRAPGQGSESQIEALKKKTKPLPSQPKNLRMRYIPFGSSSVQLEGGVGTDDSEMEITFKEPRGCHIDGEAKKKKKKRKHTDVDGSIHVQDPEPQSQAALPRKKSKKSHNHDDAAHHKQESGSLEGSKRGRSQKSGTQKSIKKHRDETSQERRARREERKRKKEEKSRAE
ncbi:hypothetical protein CISG_07244 [Coccidioides immitis RMSCC 3703]|uniref:Uncharacterized protein n=1 Tax=Coccidioides immitis RMSCC 3703 TaxID=454286 RepID=A0A0J8R5U8_COCIT|nr:hypothetical protein CISG_07244 [Coccidioides immitis RMSCC 3703]